MQEKKIFSQEKYSTDSKLLLCQLVYDSKEDNSWQDILERFINHPIITRLHRNDSLEVASIQAKDLPHLVIEIINDTMSKPEVAENLSTVSKRPRGRRPFKTDATVRPVEQESVSLDFFQLSGGEGRELLSSCCSKLHKTCITEIKRKLSNNRKEFGQVLNKLT